LVFLSKTTLFFHTESENLKQKLGNMLDTQIDFTKTESNRGKLENVLNFLKNAKDPRIILDSQEARNAVHFVKQLIFYNFYRDSADPYKIFMVNEYQYIWTSLTTHFHAIIDTLEPNNQNAIVFDDLIAITNCLCAYSLTYRLFYFRENCLVALLGFLNNKRFCDTFNKMDCYVTIIMNINWLSKNAEMYKQEWNELHAAETLLRVAKTYSNGKINAYMAFVNVANDKLIESLEDTQYIIKLHVKMLNDVADIFNQPDVLLKRGMHEFIEEDDHEPIKHEVYSLVVYEYNVQYTVTGLILPLYRLSVNNKIKYSMYCENNLRDPLRVIIFKGNDIEKKYALQLLAQLCFDPLCIDIIRSDVELRKQIMLLANKTDTIVKQLPKICKQIEWAFQMQDQSANKMNAVSGATDAKSKNQIMISYNAASRDLCLKVKEALEFAGYKVWIDVEEIHGSSLEAMARAVESSDVILMCVTEKYRQSVNCQAEAQYSFKLQKPIVPLIMQKGYENVDGWLGIIMGDKIFINYMKYSFEECTKRLMNELSKAIPVTGDPSKAHSVDTKMINTVVTTQQNTAFAWSENEVNVWFNDKNVDPGIVNALKPCNGELLHQLFLLQQEAPEFFYQSVSKNQQVGLRNVLLFACNLKKLF
jgi:hypothetical protein